MPKYRSAALAAVDFFFLSGAVVVPSVRGDIPGDSPKDENDRSGQKSGLLSCARFGGPTDEKATAEMVYWRDIPRDTEYVSPYRLSHRGGAERKKYITFEPDAGGFNNVRMAMETTVTMAIAMGRTLVMPPRQRVYLLDDKDDDTEGVEKGSFKTFTFNDFFDFESIARDYPGLDTIGMEEYIEKEIRTGNIRHPKTGASLDPPDRMKNRNGYGISNNLKFFLRDAAVVPDWDFEKCIVVFPADDGVASSRSTSHLDEMLEDLLAEMDSNERIESFRNRPTPVDAPVKDRMREMLSYRRKLCIYDRDLQEAPVLHFKGEGEGRDGRLLVHFYSFLFFEDYRQDLWMKRFVRDRIRYVDEIQCAAARIVDAIWWATIRDGVADSDGTFDAFHIRRGDFQFTELKISAEEIYENVKHLLPEKSVVYIATDERNKTFFNPLGEHYKLYFLSDFMNEVGNLNKNFYGMLETLIASKSRTFIGTWYSTFTGYINRIRGYHSQRISSEAIETGKLDSYYYDKEHMNSHRDYEAISYPFWSMEFPISWRDLDESFDEPSQLTRRMYTVFSTTCSPYHDWQSQALSYNHHSMGIEGELVRLMACDEDEHYELPENAYDNYRVVRTPKFEDRCRQAAHDGGGCAALNRPMGLTYWLTGLSDDIDLPHNDDVVIILYSDQLFLSGNLDLSVITDGYGTAARYGLGRAWFDDWGKDFCNGRCEEDALLSSNFDPSYGAPYVFTAFNALRFASMWTFVLRDMLNWGHTNSNQDMFAAVIAAQRLGLKVDVRGTMVSLPHVDEPWEYVGWGDSSEPRTRAAPGDVWVALYCQQYAVGDFQWWKGAAEVDLRQCDRAQIFGLPEGKDTWALAKARRQPLVRSVNGRETVVRSSINAWMLENTLKPITEAINDYYDRFCSGGGGDDGGEVAGRIQRSTTTGASEITPKEGMVTTEPDKTATEATSPPPVDSSSLAAAASGTGEGKSPGEALGDADGEVEGQSPGEAQNDGECGESPVDAPGDADGDDDGEAAGESPGEEAGENEKPLDALAAEQDDLLDECTTSHSGND